MKQLSVSVTVVVLAVLVSGVSGTSQPLNQHVETEPCEVKIRSWARTTKSDTDL